MEQLRQQDMVQKVKHYLEHKLPITTLKPYEKGPNTPGWNSDKSTLVNTFQKADNIADQNIGLCLAWGVDAAGNSKPWATLDVDDLQRTREIFDGQGISLDDLIYGLDSVTIESGVPNRTKALFRLSKPLKKYQHSEGGKMIFEFRCADSNGNTDQDVLPPSIHPKTNQKYQWGGKGNWAATPMMPDALVNLWQAYLVSDKPKANGKASRIAIDPADDLNQPSLSEVRQMLRQINVSSLPRKDWITIGMGIHYIDPTEEGFNAFNQWSVDDSRYDPEGIKKDWASFNRGGGVTGNSVRYFVNQYADKIPTDSLPLPTNESAEITHTESARHIWGLARKHGKVFHRGGVPVELQGNTLTEVTSSRLPTLVEELAALSGLKMGTLRSYGDRPLKWQSASLSGHKARIILAEPKSPREMLDEIRIVSHTPFLTKDGTVLSKGFHPEHKVLVLDGEVADVPLVTAVKTLKNLLQDFRGRESADISRMMAAILTPALKPGKLIDGHTPVFFFEANESQTGKGTYAELVSAIYGDSTAQVKQAGAHSHNSMDKQLDTFMYDGRQHICFDNFRGTLRNRVLESLVTGSDASHTASKKYAEEKVIDPSDFNWYMTSNGVVTTPDMFNRYCMISMLKQPEEYEWTYGDKQRFHQHVRDSHPLYLGCVFAVWKKWIEDGCPEQKSHGHNFSQWAGACDYVIRNYFELPPLMKGMEGKRYAENPRLSSLRDLSLMVSGDGRMGEYLMPSKLGDMAASGGLSVCSVSKPFDQLDESNRNIQMGKFLKSVFSDNPGGIVTVAGFNVHQRVEKSLVESRSDKFTYAFTEVADH